MFSYFRFYRNKLLNEKAFVKNSLWILAMQVTQRLFSLCVLYFLVRAITPEQFGQYSYILSWTATASIFCLPGMGNAINQSVARGYTGTFRKGIQRTFLTSFLGTGLLIALSIWQHFSGNTPLAAGFLIASIFFPLSQGLIYWKSYFAGKESFSAIAKLNFLAAACNAGFIIFFVLLFPGSILVPLLISLSVLAIQNTLLVFYILRMTEYNSEQEEGMVMYGTVTTFYSMFSILAANIDKLLIAGCISVEALAIYVAAERLPELLRSMIKGMASVVDPRFAKSKSYTKETDNAIIAFVLAATTIILFVSFVMIPPLIQFIFGDIYSESIPYAQILCLSTIFAAFSMVRSSYIRSQKDEKSIKDINIYTSVARIVVSAICIPTLGIAGAVISVFVYRLSRYVIIRKALKARHWQRE